MADKKTVYSEETKSNVLAALQENKLGHQEIADKFDVKIGTLRSWNKSETKSTSGLSEAETILVDMWLEKESNKKLILEWVLKEHRK